MIRFASLLGIRPPRRRRRKLRALNWPTREQLHYSKRLLDEVRNVEAQVRELLFPYLETFAWQTSLQANVRADGVADELGRIMDRVRDAVTSTAERAEALAVEMLERVQRVHASQFVQAYEDALGINPFAGSESWLPEQMALRVRENVALIKSLPEQMLTQIESTVSRELLNGTHARDIAALLRERFDVCESRALTIATDQTGKWFSSLNKLRQQDAGVDEYEWMTAGDGAVRPKHAALNGTRRKWGEGIEPGQEIRCRCQPIPVLPEYDDEEE